MRMRNLSVAIVVAALVGTFPAIEALAQPPSNDSRAGAVLVTSVPFLHEEDTSEATASGPKFCSNNGSVFFKLHATSDQDLQVDTIGSGYDTVLAVFTKTAGVINEIGCSDDAVGLTSAVRFHADAGMTYVFMVGFCCGNGQSGGGGNLTFAVSETPTGIDFMANVGAHGTVDPDGIARIRGRAECSQRGVVFIEGTVRQRRGDLFVARGSFFTQVACDPGSSAHWHADADTETSVVFGDGPARVQWDAAITNGFDFAQQDLRQRSVQLMEP